MEGAPKYIPPSGRQVPKALQLRRMKFGWRVLLICNFALGAYLFTVPRKKNSQEQRSIAAEQAPSLPVESTTQFYEEPVFTPLPDLVSMQQQPTTKDQEQDLFGLFKRTKS